MSNPYVAPVDDGTRRLSTFYIFALSAVALLSIAGQILVQSQLARQRHDSTVVNLAGRQRMLSQRVGKCAAMLAAEGPAADAGPYLEELRTTLPVWRRNHVAMQQGDAELGLPGDNSPGVVARFDALQPTFDAVYAAAERIVQTASARGGEPPGPAALRADAAIVLAREGDYLRGMDAIVYEYETEAAGRVRRLQIVEQILLALTLGVLVLEGWLIFRPAVLRIRESISALHKTGEALRRAKETAETANRAKTAFLANMSHEIRTPLHAVLGAAELLRRSNVEGERQEYIDVIDESGQMLLCLLNDLLDLSKIEAGKIELSPAPLELRSFLRGVIAMFAPAADAKSLELRSTTADDVPRFITADALRLRQVLANLLNNALKFTDSGSIALQTSATKAGGGGHYVLRFAVTDTGVGIPHAEQSRIFEAFTQVRPPDGASRGGVGLGLDIASRLVGLMNGRFDVRSEPSRGSTFTFEIECPASDASDAGEEPSSESAATNTRPLRILAAEDAPMIRRLLERMLRGAGHQATCVADGGEAVQAFEKERFDLVLLDLRMPVVDGLAAAATMRASERDRSLPRTPIVALTAAAPSDFAGAALPDDFDGYLLKPFTGEMLAQILHRFGAPTADAERTTRVMARLQGRKALLDELVELFLQDAPKLLDEIQQAYQLDDRRRLKTVVHRLRGQLEMLEVEQAAQIARRLEQECDQGEIVRMKDDLQSLTSAWPDMCREVALLASK